MRLRHHRADHMSLGMTILLDDDRPTDQARSFAPAALMNVIGVGSQQNVYRWVACAFDCGSPAAIPRRRSAAVEVPAEAALQAAR